jgi:transcriptional regulator with XRE-family HTH domain
MSVSLEAPLLAATINAMPRSSPTSRRRELSTRLKQLRLAADVTVDQAAETLGCSTDKIHWMERADWTDPKWRDVRDLLDRYGVTDDAEREELIALARTGGEKDWWQPYTKTLSKRRSKYPAYLGLEADATEALTYQLAVIPGLLQTDDYARALIEAGPDVVEPKEAEERIAIRRERQRVLTGDDPIRLWAVIDEAAIRRKVGGSDVMRAQVAYLLEMARQPNIVVQVLPFARGAHPALAGSFTILSSGEDFPDVAYVETIGGELLIDAIEGVDRYRGVFRRLNIAAASPEDTIEMLLTEVNGT